MSDKLQQQERLVQDGGKMAQWKKALDTKPNLNFILETQDGSGTLIHEHIHISTQ